MVGVCCALSLAVRHQPVFRNILPYYYTHTPARCVCVKQREKPRRARAALSQHLPANSTCGSCVWSLDPSRLGEPRALGLGYCTVALGSSERCTIAVAACPGRELGAPRARLLASSGTNGDIAPARPSPPDRGSPSLPLPNRARRVRPSPASGRRPSRRGPRHCRPSYRPHSPPECGAQELSG